MSESTDPQQNPQEPAARRKSKPKFEVPADAGQPAEAGWVYRDDESAGALPTELPVPGAEVVEPIALESVPAAEKAPPRRTATANRQTDPLLVSAFTLVATGLGLMTRTAMTLVSTPMNLVRRRSR